MVDEDDILQRLEEADRQKTEEVIAMLIAEGHAEAADRLRKKIRDINLGIDGAQRTWESISDAQRRTLQVLGTGRYLARSPGSRTRYHAYGEPHAEGNVCGIATVRNLCARELCHVDGGATDPERKIIITERGRFVLKYGPTA